MSKYDNIIKMAENFETMATQMVSIEIPQYYFDVLSHWASVGRTIDAAIEMIDGLSGYVEPGDNYSKGLLDDKMHIVSELHDIKQALDACHTAIKTKSFSAK